MSQSSVVTSLFKPSGKDQYIGVVVNNEKGAQKLNAYIKTDEGSYYIFGLIDNQIPVVITTNTTIISDIELTDSTVYETTDNEQKGVGEGFSYLAIDPINYVRPISVYSERTSSDYNRQLWYEETKRFVLNLPFFADHYKEYAEETTSSDAWDLFSLYYFLSRQDVGKTEEQSSLEDEIFNNIIAKTAKDENKKFIDWQTI